MNKGDTSPTSRILIAVCEGCGREEQMPTTNPRQIYARQPTGWVGYGRSRYRLSGHALLVLAAFVVTIAAALGKAPLWIAVMLLVLLELLRVMPVR